MKGIVIVSGGQNPSQGFQTGNLIYRQHSKNEALKLQIIDIQKEL